jgi:hypothetical protein
MSLGVPQNPKTPYVSREIEDSVMNISIEATIKSITSLTIKVKPQSYSLRYFGRYISKILSAMKHPPLTQPTFDESSNLRRRPIVKCPVAPCGYVGRYDNVKRHVKSKHHHAIDGTPAVPQILPSSAEASEVQMASPRGEIEMPVELSQPLPPRNIRTRVCKR